MVGIDPANLAHLMGQEAPKRHVAQKRYVLPQQSFRQPEMLTLAQKQIRSLLINPQWAAYTELPESIDLMDEDISCLAGLAACIRQSPTPPSSARLLEAMRPSPYYGHLCRILHTADSGEYFDSGSERELREFRDGMDKLMQTLKKRQIDALRQKLSSQGLSAEEKKLLQSLLQHRPLSPEA